MENIQYIAVSQQTALSRQMEIIANNIANISTPGFKAENLTFKEYMIRDSRGDKTSFVQDAGVAKDMRQGPLQHTGADFDFAINGDGFFTIGAAEGNRYTRSGHFKLDDNGQIVNFNGDPLLSENGNPLVVPLAASKITMTKDGKIYADNVSIGKVGLVKFENPQSLSPEMAGLYTTSEDPQPVTNPELYQGMIEESNVQGVVEMTKMMQISRSYESTQRIIEREDDRVRQAIKRLAGNN